ncbi:hypothetical protein H1D32_04725 [Anaerobacillus sp. CMMVII]|uniref:hypothetical protein n=1 Tax=Anaerobacillus sp. CMMVII TaxID=2755588 RepID=UPI0021B75672|nr:hypothetical protein [Anaerobacillus sp. CMMVII]MCT8137104.1 hypothetical protein [Anaerobacillus sp. CMMVII]
MKKKIHFYLLPFLVLILMTACGNKQAVEEDKSLHVMFLSQIPSAYEQGVVNMISPILGEVELDLNLFPASHEKLAIEIVAKKVDLFIVDYSLRHIILDSYGLSPLDEFIDFIPSSISYEEYILEDDESGELHLYAVPLSNDSQLLQKLGLESSTPLLAVIVKHSPYQEIGKQILEQLL